ncbi:hypothetical protein ANSO36C_65940 (plasmid) [Nostoc cf. commune SO-36]|uniref:Transmembrane anchor protein n=2 Tax=Nostoc commune TaxID=1178 RepID=A0ABN6QFT1_NOSCO|nr:hypothetical protein ANSO36C_65940 [Nostoc cf. commune SO-36]
MAAILWFQSRQSYPSTDKEAADQAKNLVANTEDKQGGINAEAATTPKPTTAGAAILNHEMQVTLAPDEGKEIKLDMSKGNKVQYTWSTDGGKANFDVHADSQTLGINYHQYSKGSSQSEQGELEAAFDGSHGWFWRNRTSNTITITLKTIGEYTDIKQK